MAAAACRPPPPATPDTPEDVVATTEPGSAVLVQGTVFTLTFDDLRQAPDAFPIQPDRWILVRTAVPSGVTRRDLDVSRVDAAWGLGLRLTGEDLAARRFQLPQGGDTVRAAGTFARGPWAGRTMPMVEGLTELTVVAGAPPLADVGRACAVDMDCADDLWCDRATSTCAAVPSGIAWGDPRRDVNGACDTDADCPAGQTCDSRTAITATGPYAAPYFVSRDAGRHLCVPTAGSTRESLCGRSVSTADLVGGRFATGKEVCVRGVVQLSLIAADGDTHLQLYVDEPLPYPAASATYDIFGATTENAPPYKDPAVPRGPIVDPAPGAVVTALGTYRYDDGHGWFEVHPVKAFWTGR